MHSYQRKSRTKKRRSPDASPQENALPNISRLINTPTVENVLALQRLVGNAATRQLLQPTRVQPNDVQPKGLIQRLPNSAVIQSVAGTAKKDKKFGGKVLKSEGTRYKALLAAFDAYHEFLNGYAVDLSLPTLHSHFFNLKKEVLGYVGSKGSGFKFAYFKNLATQIDTERDYALNRYKAHQASGLRQVKWAQLVGVGANTVIKDADVTGSDKGGSHSVEKTTMNGKQGFYKGNIDVVPNADVMYGKDFAANLYAGTALQGMDSNALQNAYNVPDYAGMFDPKSIPKA
ncbi:MAG: hypothetical protein H7175_26020, partial [Burkholderiales bacterium]|nr:hypothetical protein [Anaerolineae bacterium]